ncbi:MAG TPA: hypothetical protein DDX39_12350 [Bacteroidales bacterium]|nr:MAG: hypothetical protein A2W98_11755 [Bacteroidetes bacterium GWF2_33_38]HBF89424.1 hypothetical protein [Bacteroidales bacterium]
MKTLMLFLIGTIISANIFAQELDTTTVYKVDDIQVTIDDESIEIKSSDLDTNFIVRIGGKEVVIGDRTDGWHENPRHMDESDTTIIKKKERKFNGHWAGIELGINNYVTSSQSLTLSPADAFMELRATKSLGVNLNFMEFNIPIVKNNFGITTGMGLQINNYRLNNNVVLDHNASPINVISDSLLINKDVSKYKLTATYLTIPLLFEFQTPLRKATNNSGEEIEDDDDEDGAMFYAAIGGFGGIRIGTHSKQVYETNNSEYKDKIRNDFNLSLFEYGVTARVGISALKLFANYNLSTLFEENKGPELYPFTAGLCFTF